MQAHDSFCSVSAWLGMANAWQQHEQEDKRKGSEGKREEGWEKGERGKKGLSTRPMARGMLPLPTPMLG